MMKKLVILVALVCLLVACGSEQTAVPTQSPAPANTEPAATEPATAVPSTTATFAATATAVAAAPNSTPIPGQLFSPVSLEPVLAHGADETAWDAARLDPGAIIYHDGQFHMFRNAFDSWPGPVAIGYATSPDGLTWTDQGDNPLITTADIAAAEVAAVVTSGLVEADGTWVLYFHTWQTSRANLGSGDIYRLTAPAPTGPWTADPTPLLEKAADINAWDNGQVSQASVIRSDEGYVMYYTGADQAGSMMIGRATSPDGLVWTKYDDPTTTEAAFATNDPILIPGDQITWDSQATWQARVVTTDDGLVMAYRTLGPGAAGQGIGLATSQDGIQWTKMADNPIFLPDALDSVRWFGSPALVYQEDTFYLFTEAVTSNAGANIYLATHQGELAGTTAVTAVPTIVDTTGNLIYISHVGGNPAYNWEKANLEAYQELRPNLEIRHLSHDYYSSFINTVIHHHITDEAVPDVMSGLIVGVLREYVADGRIADISDLWQEQGWDEVFPASLKEMVTFEGKQYFVPMAIQWNSIFYRQSIFDEVGLTPPTTWEEMLAACDILNAAGFIPFTISVSAWPPPMGFWFTHINLRLNGSEFHEALMRGEERYDDPRVRAVFEHWQQLFDHNCFAENSASNNYQAGIRDFSSGNTAMYNHGEWLLEFISPDVAADTSTFAFPTINPEVTERGELVPMYGAFILSNASNPEEARAFLAYLGSAASQQSNFEAIGRVASNLQVDRDLYDDVHATGLEIVENADYITQLYGANTSPDVASAGYEAMGDFWRNPENLDEILAAWEAARVEVYGSR